MCSILKVERKNIDYKMYSGNRDLIVEMNICSVYMSVDNILTSEQWIAWNVS